MTNSILENIRRSLGRTTQISSPQGTLLSLRPTIYEPRLPESADAEIARFLDEIKKLSGVGQKLSPTDIDSALKKLIEDQNIRKATVWETPHLTQLGIAEILNSLGVDLVSPNASKHDMALCDLGITEADYLLPETGTLVLRSSTEKPRAVSLLPRVHLAIVRPEMLRADMHQTLTFVLQPAKLPISL